jgi:hypothetical protein
MVPMNIGQHGVQQDLGPDGLIGATAGFSTEISDWFGLALDIGLRQALRGGVEGALGALDVLVQHIHFIAGAVQFQHLVLLRGPARRGWPLRAAPGWRRCCPRCSR